MPFYGLTSQSTVNRSFLAPGIVTGWPRLAESAAEERLGETHRRIFLSGDGGSSRARRPEGPGRKNRWIEGELLAQIDGSGNVVYVHNSYIGAPQKITDPSRTLVWDQIIEPFGEVSSTPTTTTPTAWRFPGQYANANNSLSHNGARDYDPSCACYVESDPSGLAGGPNPTAYAGQNPTQAIDPAGLDLMVITGGWNGGFNVLGHSSIAVTGAGVYSYGTGVTTPLGASASGFLSAQAGTRNQTITIIPTTPEQDALALQYLNAHPDEQGVGYLDNCSSRTQGALDAAGMSLQDPATLGLTSPPSTPGNAGASAATVQGATTIYIPKNGAIPYQAISQFNPINTAPAQAMSTAP
jgi:RHS repeat-associated protein